MNTNITKQMEMILYRTEMNELDKEVVVAKIATTTQHGAVEKNTNQGNQLLQSGCHYFCRLPGKFY